MKQRFDEVLAECLEAVTSGRRTVEECLALYPAWRDHLEPLLRFGRRLGEAPLPEPDSAFKEAARQRFLAAAQAKAETVSEPRRRFLPALPRWSWRPQLGLRMGLPAHWQRAVATVAAGLAIGLVGFSSFVVASAGDALPGDWRYPVKRFTERTRLTLTFGEDARRDYRITLAEERLREVQELASHERQIGESVLKQLVATTEPLVKALEPDSVPADQIERITDLTAEQQDTLDRVAPLVEDEAVDELAQAMVVSSEGHDRAVQALETALSQPPGEVPGSTTPGAGTPAPGTGAASSPTPAATPTPGAGTPSVTPQPTTGPGELTPAPGEATPQPLAPTPTPAPPERSRTFLPDDTTAGLSWDLWTIGDFSLRAPADDSGEWAVSTLAGIGGERILVGHYSRGGFDASISVQVSTGEASIQVLADGALRQASPDELSSLVAGPIADVILHVLESINAGQ